MLSAVVVFSKSFFLKNSFRNTIRVSNSFDRDQARPFDGPDLAQTVCKGHQQTILVGKKLTEIKPCHMLLTHTYILTLLILVTPKCVLWQTVKTQLH